MIFELDIGDWSGDGHGKYKTFTIETDCKSISEVRNIYFYLQKKHIPPCKICYIYGKPWITQEELNKVPYAEAALEKGIYDYEDGKYFIGPTTMVYIFIEYMNISKNHTFKLISSIREKLHFYGKDDQNRSINFIGYGLF